ncbi:DgyrCDS7639 [Dimorphilus gyrociliatus]|uniref:DgyrCDS7639 n=1 Tax=Dimorphilus gyrociliatus TaxID=2664684 RepID=A0A7I8VSM1_9ANNE|nr:DgyrCDS7639 [Dimorphilus gyrociliatus]
MLHFTCVLGDLIFHYGCYTCEACKVFFRRSLKSSIDYECVTKRKVCTPAPDFRFQCRACRFKKCLDIGMSRHAIRTGRYTKRIHNRNKILLTRIENSKKTVPYLINHTDSQDLIIQCMNIFHDAVKIDWSKEISDFQTKFRNASAVCEDGIFPKNDYMEIFQVSGLEIDYRKSFMSILNSVMEISSTRFINAVSKIPGLKELSDEKFFHLLISHKDDIQIFNSSTSKLIWTEDGLSCNLGDGYVLTLKKDDFKNLTDANFVISEETVLQSIQNLNFTIEESIFLLIISLLNPIKGNENLRLYYNRYLIAFTSYHYGAYTCEACKAFFKRTVLRPNNLKCIANDNACIATEQMKFICRSCRFKRCLAIGMSLNSSKIGRTTRERLKSLQMYVKNSQAKSEKVPYLFNQTDSQDLIIMCSNVFSETLNLDWQSTIKDFDIKFKNAARLIEEGFFPQNDFMDILSVTGIEIDNRKGFSSLIDSIIVSSFLHFMKCIKKLPGLDILSEEDYYKVFFAHKHDIELLIYVVGGIIWKDEIIIINFDDKHQLKVPKKILESLLDDQAVNLEEEACIRITEANITFEEALLIIALRLFSPNKKFPHFKEFHHRLAVAFTRYLKSQYSNKYYLRFLQLMNLFSYFNEAYLIGDKWIANNFEYLSTIHCRPELLRHVWLDMDIRETMNLLQSLAL